jgi:C_GCAxxG_C_C family probable redox protein
MREVDDAADFFGQGFSCSQAVLSAYCERFGLPREAAFSAYCEHFGLPRKVALRLSDELGGGLGGGTGDLGKTCGAVTGAMMVLGLAHGLTRPEDHETKKATTESLRSLVERFEACHGSVVCRDLLGHEIDTPEKLRAVREKGLLTTVCPKLVRSAAKITGDLLDPVTTR